MQRLPAFLAAVCLLASFVPGCWRAESGDGPGLQEAGEGEHSAKISGEIRIDGSSTVYPISEAVAEEFSLQHRGVKVTVGFSGTGGGMKKFYGGEIDICDASREMKPNEVEQCQQAGIDFIRLSIAYDGIAVVTNAQNDWCDELTVEQLKHIWRPDNPALQWSDLDASWPDEKIKLHGPGTDSGTFDYFTEEIVGQEKSCRSDFSPNEDDNMLVTGVAGDRHAMGYFGFAYYTENANRLNLVKIDGGEGAIAPSLESIMTNAYKPLSRPLFIYVRTDALKRPEITKFVKFYLDQAASLAEEVGYVPAPEAVNAENQAALADAL